MEHLTEALRAYVAALRPEADLGVNQIAALRRAWHNAFEAASDLERRGALIYLAAESAAYQRLAVAR